MTDALLTDVEVRVLGSLIEKEVTTPDYYPLSLNALTSACNQSSNRYPVVHFDEETVARATDTLRQKNLVHVVDKADSRVTRYRHVMGEAMALDKREIAVMSVLMLRGPQTTGEIRTRSHRMYDFEDLDRVEGALSSLIARQPALAIRLPRQSGQKEVRYAHLLSGETVFDNSAAGDADRIGKLEETIETLRTAVEELQKQFEQFKKQFE
jgi:uncharacterized protein YceH (UPF0502 family)